MRRRWAPGCEWDSARLAGRVRLPSGHDRYVGTCQVQRLCAAPPRPAGTPPLRVPAVSGGWRCPRSPQPAPPAPREDVCVSVPSPARARLARLPPGDAFARGVPLRRRLRPAGPGRAHRPLQRGRPWGSSSSRANSGRLGGLSSR